MWSKIPNLSDNAASENLVDRLVHAFVVERTRHRRQLVAELARRRRHRVPLDGLGVLPDLHHREVVEPVVLLHDLEAEIAVALATLLAELPERGDPVVLLRGDDVDVRGHVDRVAHGSGVDRADREPAVNSLVGGGVADRRDLLAHLRRAGALAVRLPRLLIFPDREDDELLWLIDTLCDLAAEIAAFLAGRLAVAAEDQGGVGFRRRHDLDVDHGVDVTLDRRRSRGRRRRLSLSCSDRADRHHTQSQDEHSQEPFHGVTPLCMLPQAASADWRFRANSARSASAFFRMMGWPNSPILPRIVRSVSMVRWVPVPSGTSVRPSRARSPPPRRRSLASARMRARHASRSRSSTVMTPSSARRMGPTWTLRLPR